MIDAGALDVAWEQLTALRSPVVDRPLFPGAVLLCGVEDEIVAHRAAGFALCYADQEGTPLPEQERIATSADTIFDLASISKLFTSLVIMGLVESGCVELDRRVIDYLPEFAAADKQAVTVRQLLVHTSGFPAEIPLWRLYTTPRSRIRGALEAELVAPPGTTYCYSDLNLITLGELAARITGHGLDRLVADRICRPLGLTDTGYRPDPALRHRIAATEFQQLPDRGMVHGQVHDENAWSLDGVAGHAGVFSTAADLARLARAIIDRELLGDAAASEMITNQTAGFPGHDHGLGFELNQSWYMGELAGPHTIGHTGYTGTSLVIDLERRAYVILLTNRVHPNRGWGSVNPARVLAADGLARTLSGR
jgi:CubicO group peptidase (beta-lactamase class C family)